MIGIHDVRLYNFALLDILGTFLLALISYYIPFIYKYESRYWVHVIAWFLLAILIHYLLGINTTGNYYLGISDKPTKFVDNPKFLWISS